MIGYFDCFSGVSGDMALGALLDAGLPLATLQEQLERLQVPGYRLDVKQCTDQEITGLELRVFLEAVEQPPRRLADILRLLEASRLDEGVAAAAAAVFHRLAHAEGAVHGVAPEEVYFHEVGAVDALVDIVGTVAGLRALGVERLYASALPLGSGSVESRHGTLPLPAPGTLELLAEVGAPTRPVATDRELVTPTGAALLAELATFEQPPMRVRKIGYGFGRQRLPWPNCLRLWLGEPIGAEPGRDEVVLLEANIDDMTPEALGFAMERLFTAGALDVYFQPIQMKKNRPAFLLGVLADLARAAELANVVLAETSTLGVRASYLQRFLASRRGGTVDTRFGPLAVKIKQVGDRRIVSPEYEDAARLARDHRVPLAEIYRAAERADPLEDE